MSRVDNDIIDLSLPVDNIIQCDGNMTLTSSFSDSAGKDSSVPSVSRSQGSGSHK